MEKVEEDLARSKSLREKQAKEFSRQLEDLKIKHEKEVCWIFLSGNVFWRTVFQVFLFERVQVAFFPESSHRNFFLKHIVQL